MTSRLSTPVFSGCNWIPGTRHRVARYLVHSGRLVQRADIEPDLPFDLPPEEENSTQAFLKITSVYPE